MTVTTTSSAIVPVPRPNAPTRCPRILVDSMIDDSFSCKPQLNGQPPMHVKRYKRGRHLGKGGFAQVYAFTSQDSGREYAVKVIPKESIAKESSRKKLLNEIAIHRAVKHQHIVRFERFFEDKRNVYIVLELCENHTMMELVKQRGHLTETEAQFFLWQIVITLEHLHGERVIHRDLKLGNLFLADGLQIKLGDFGLATRLEPDEDRRKTICGTPNYIAPEILAGSQDGHSFEVDVWALGVILYTMLFGVPPFETTSVKATYKKIRDNSYSFPAFDSPLYAPTTRAAKDLISWMLRGNPIQRPSISQMKCHAFFTQSPFPTIRLQDNSALHTPYEFQHACAEEIAQNRKADRMESEERKHMISSSSMSPSSSMADVPVTIHDNSEKASPQSMPASRKPTSKPSNSASHTVNAPSSIHQQHVSSAQPRPILGSPIRSKRGGLPIASAPSAGISPVAHPPAPRATSRRLIPAAPIGPGTTRSVLVAAKDNPVLRDRAEMIERINQRHALQSNVKHSNEPSAQATSSTAANEQQVALSDKISPSNTNVFTATNFMSSHYTKSPVLYLPSPANTCLRAQQMSSPSPQSTSKNTSLSWTDSPSQAVSIVSSDSISPTAMELLKRVQTAPSHPSGEDAKTRQETVQNVHKRQSSSSVVDKQRASTAEETHTSQLDLVTKMSASTINPAPPLHVGLTSRSNVLQSSSSHNVNCQLNTATAKRVSEKLEKNERSKKDASELSSSSLERTEQMIEESFIDCAPSASNFAGPSYSVRQWADRQEKYGFAYVLNTGQAGWLYRDETIAIADKEGKCFHYSEGSGSEFKLYSFDDPPHTLRKKALLLLQQSKKLKSGRSTETYAPILNNNGVPIYLKKWCRSREGLMFRLSNNSVQTVYRDGIEVMLSAGDQGTVVHFYDRNKIRHSCLLRETNLHGRSLMERRVRHTRDNMAF